MDRLLQESELLLKNQNEVIKSGEKQAKKRLSLSPSVMSCTPLVIAVVLIGLGHGIRYAVQKESYKQNVGVYVGIITPALFISLAMCLLGVNIRIAGPVAIILGVGAIFLDMALPEKE